MKENLLSPSNLILFGREFPLTFTAASIEESQGGANTFLRDQLKVTGANSARLARIYAFSYEGHFYNLPRPAVFLVHGAGNPISGSGLAQRGVAAGARPTTTDSGLVAREFDFEFGEPPAAPQYEAGEHLRYWEYDKADMSLRIDITSGHLYEILIEATLSPDVEDAITSRAVANTRAVVNTRAVMNTRAVANSRDELSARHRLKG